ncbi:MAG: VOC family protein [Acidobacteriota bacterium]|nr:VOC family protein [Acidobacteriota bacterium]
MAERVKLQASHQAASASRAGTFHHVGFVVTSIIHQGSAFARSLGAEWNEEIIHDPLQQARVTFMHCGGPNTPAIELVEPDSEKSPLQKFLAKGGGGLHHICYEVDSLDAQLQYCRSTGSLIVRQPLPALAFAGRHIAWVYTTQKLLVEYLERA